jgi:PTS system mannose-specific IIA component/PTS system mannose-specific IIB component
MLAIIVGTHGHFAAELVKTCEMICGATQNVKAVTLVPGESADDVVTKYEAAIAEMDTSNGVIFLNDLFGGSPYNAACRLAVKNEQYGIVTGVNLPMLVEMVSYQLVNPDGGDIKEIMEKAVEAGNAGLHTFHASSLSEENNDEGDDL